MKTILMIAAISLCACVACGEVWQQTIESPSDGVVFSVDIGTTIESLDSVTLHLVGYDKVGGYSCDGPGGTVYYPEINFLDVTFGQDGPVDDVILGVEMWQDDLEGFDFDIVHEFDISDPSLWDFLNNGPVDLSIMTSMSHPDPYGYCTHVYSEFRLDLLTLIISYNNSVANDTGTWAAVKAFYR